MASKRSTFVTSLLIFFFTLSGCQKGALSSPKKRTIASTSTEAKTCYSLLRALIDAKYVPVEKAIKHFELPKTEGEKLKQIVETHQLKTKEIESLFENLIHLNSFPTDELSFQKLNDFIEYSQTLFPKNRANFLANSDKLFTSEYEKSKTFKGMRKRLSTFAKQEKKMASREAFASWRKLYNGCHTKGLTQEHKQGAKFFTYFTVTVAAGSSGVFYAATNWNEEEFGTGEFYGKLTYEMANDALWAMLASYVFKDPTGGFFEKSIKMYLGDNVLVAADGFTWEQLFGDGESDANERIQELKRDPEFQKEVLKLIKHLEREKFTDTMNEKFKEALALVMDNPPKDLSIDWESITKEDLDKEDINEALMEAALLEMYESDTGEMSLGSYGADRWAFYTGLGLPFMFLDTAVTTKIYHTMCMAPANPKKAILTSALIFTAYSIFYDTIAYPMRKYLINQ